MWIKLSKKAFLVIMVVFNVRDETSLNDTALTRPSLYVWIHKWEFILGQRSNAIIGRSISPRPKQSRFQGVASDTWNRSVLLNNHLILRNDYYRLTPLINLISTYFLFVSNQVYWNSLSCFYLLTLSLHKYSYLSVFDIISTL